VGPAAPAPRRLQRAPPAPGWAVWRGLAGRRPGRAYPLSESELALLGKPRYGLALALLGLTLFCTTTLGPVIYTWSREGLPPNLLPLITPGLIGQVWGNAELLRRGLSFSLPVLLILLVHELGHYLACRRYRLPSTLPYFLPLPAVLGTLGAFIRIRVPMRNRRELFDVGVAGPLAGFAALLPFLLYGVAHSERVPLRLAAGAAQLVPGQCLAMELAARVLLGPAAAGTELRLHPFALAAWFGLLATAINLLPLGQLDGGHILYAVAGRWQRRLALPLWVALGLAGFLWGGWVIWCALIFAIGLFHPPVIDEITPLDNRRRALAAVALVVLLLSFAPRGASEALGDDAPPPAPAAAGGSAVAGLMPAPDQKSAIRVTGPSLTSSTSMCARKRPVATWQPRWRSAATSASTSGAASSGGAARSNEGRRPRASEPARVNCETTR
jgi:hypothetical protein